MAYNSEKIELQLASEPQGFLRRLKIKGQIFPFTKPNDSVATSLAKETKPSQMKEFNENNLFWSEVNLESESISNWTQVYFLLVGLVKVALVLFLPLFYLLLLIGLIFGEGGWDTRSEDFIVTTIYITFPCLIFYLHFKLVSAGLFFLAPFLKGKRVYRLSRQTGMVTLFHKGNKERFSHPFIEFDCVLMSAPSPQGHLNYNLMLVHRYNDYSVGVPISNLIGTNEKVVEYHRLWNMIQRYMDVSQPLPDILILEPARQKDPVTADYDRKTGRNPRYWRDMSDEEYQRKMAEIAAKQQSQPTTGPKLNIFK